MSHSASEQAALPPARDGGDSALTPDTPAEELPRAAHDLPPSYPPARRPAVSQAPQPAGRRSRRWRSRRPLPTLVVLAGVVFVAALVKTFVVQWYEIPTGSMSDTLEVGDRVAVTMYDSTDIRRGDVIVFTDPDHWLNVTDPTGVAGVVRETLIFLHLLPEDSGHHLIKRVIGMPGDHVVSTGSGPITVNGVAVSEPYVKAGRQPSEVAFDVVVPEGYVWVMGDNRSNSSDSRFHRGDAHDGFVPLDDVVGVARAVVWPLGSWAWLDGGEEAFAAVPEPAGAGAGTDDGGEGASGGPTPETGS